VSSAAWLSVSERSPTEKVIPEAGDVDRITTNLDDLTFVYHRPDIEITAKSLITKTNHS
jgi:hypothetical protein